MIGRDGGDGGSLAVSFELGESKSLSRSQERREIAIKGRSSMVVCGERRRKERERG